MDQSLLPMACGNSFKVNIYLHFIPLDFKLINLTTSKEDFLGNVKMLQVFLITLQDHFRHLKMCFLTLTHRFLNICSHLIFHPISMYSGQDFLISNDFHNQIIV